jgi:hypothetical protein
MRVNTRKNERTSNEMYDIWMWMIDNFGPPTAHNLNLKRWTYGNSSYTYGTNNIEWFDFTDDDDALMYTLRWA